MSHELILHQYDGSPFSEKVRKVFAHKQLAWRAVDQPMMMPKPDLLPLTGGYRRIPVLQIGADIYCDTQVIARTVERLHPEPTIYPGGSEGTCDAWSLWADKLLFMAVAAVVLTEVGSFMPPEFMADRQKMMPDRDLSALPSQAPTAREHLRAYGATLEAQLGDGRSHLLGSSFSLADAACFHVLWFLRMAQQASGAVLGELPRVSAWMQRLDGMGVGTKSALTPAQALEIARDSNPAEAPAGATESSAQEPNGLAPGMRVTVMPDDYGFDPVRGEIVFTTAQEIAIKRRDEVLGETVVHFPRIGFRVARA